MLKAGRPPEVLWQEKCGDSPARAQGREVSAVVFGGDYRACRPITARYSARSQSR